MTSTTSPLEIRPIPAETVRRLRDQGHDDHGHAWEPRIDDEGGAPLRCCLRDSKPGEEIVLVSYAPVRATVGATGPGPYDEVGPVFLHAQECDGYTDDGGYPLGWVDRPQTLRAYDADGHILGGTQLEPGDDRDAAARELLTDPDIAFLHSRNIVYGCYMLEIRRA
ncbi:MAG TPA: DUF1203 domain-containing protein [Nocardioidaceae bacterium]|nr:DUF1203 domain-containing protein [Nocardioidaceae bacterium]